MNPLAHYHLLVERLLGPDGDVEAAVGGFVGALPGDDADEVEGRLEVAWDLLVMAAAEAPLRLQQRLVALVVGVRGHELPGVRVWGQRVMTDLPLLGDRMSRAWDEPRGVDGWVRLNAFGAMLTAAGVDLLPLGLRTIVAGLEEGGARAPAVEWFRHAGEQLVEAAIHGRTYAGRLGDAAPRAEGGFSVGRWIGWRRAFGNEELQLISRFDGRIAAHYQH